MAWMTALMVLSTLMVPMLAAPASAGHNNTHDLNCTPETATNPTGVGNTHTVTCTVTGLAAGESTEVDAELVGVNTPSTAAPNNANNGADTADTPKQPDFTQTCTEAGGGTCQVTFTWTGINPGTDTLRAWIDDDQNNDTFSENAGPGGADADATEGQCAVANEDGSGCTTVAPGSKSEPDDTDVVIKNWVANLPPNATLDCDDDGAPGDEADAPASDTATNPAGEGELYTCVLFNDNGTGAGGQAGNGVQDGSEPGISGVRIDAEVLGGANDPDTAGQPAGTTATGGVNNNTTADFNDACTTGADGRCTYTFNPAENEVGTAQLCFWADNDTDNTYVAGPPGAAPQFENDGAGCTEGVAAEGNNGGFLLTDVVQKTWQTAGSAAVLDAEPEYDANPTDGDGGNTHTVTATAYDAFGNVAPNTTVDFIATGRNFAPQPICDNVLTNAQGVATCTYADVGTNADPIPPGTSEFDLIAACIDPAALNGFNCPSGGPETLDEPERNDAADTVRKDWFNQVPAPASMQIDMEGVTQFPRVCPAGAFDSQAAPNTVGSSHTVCVQVLDSNSQPLVGQQVTFTITGVGNFYNDTNGNDNYDPAAGDTIIGKSVTVSTDQNGEAFAQLTSTQSGTSSVQATTGSVSATGTKPWQSAPLRTVDCEPETAENELNEPHTIVCNAKDINGNNVNGAVLAVYEDGPGTIENGPANFGPCVFYGQTRGCYFYTTDSSGNIQIVLNSQVEGTMTVEAADAADIGDSRGGAGDAANDVDEDCDMRANEGPSTGGPGSPGVGSQPGAPAGQCFDAVTKDYVQPDTQCDDGVDNDGDGFIDFGDDPGCESAADDSEAPFNEPEPTREQVDRTTKIKKTKHVRLGRGKRALMVKGVVNAPGVDNQTRDLCAGSVPVKVQLRAGGEWITRKSDTTGGNYNNRQGGYVFKVLIRDIAGRYRAVAPKFQVDDPDTNRELRCLKAQDTKRHRH